MADTDGYVRSRIPVAVASGAAAQLPARPRFAELPMEARRSGSTIQVTTASAASSGGRRGGFEPGGSGGGPR